MRILALLAGLVLIFSAVLLFRYEDQFRRLLDRGLSFVQGPLAGRIPVVRALVGGFQFLHQYRFTLPVLLLVVLIYIWLVTSGSWRSIDSPSRYYANLAWAFERGSLHILTEPAPELLALSNPYDPRVRGDMDVPVDITLYHGKYYLYWGPAPALLLAAVSPFVPGRVGDQNLVFGFALGLLMVMYLTILILRDRFFAGLPKWMLSLSVLVAGLVFPCTFILDNTYSARMIYEAAISGGQFFLMAGVLIALTILEMPARSSWRMALAGLAWALAIGSRLTLLLPVGVLVCMLVLHTFQSAGSWKQGFWRLMPLALPLALGLASLGWYNWARFGSFTESGLYYQLAGVNLQANYDKLWGPGYVIPNLYNYMLHPFQVVSEIPFVQPVRGVTTAFSTLYSIPEFYNSQIMTGFLVLVPFTLFALVLPGLASAGIFKRRAGQPARSGQTAGGILWWFVAGLATAFAAAFGSLMTFFWAGMRYMDDFMPMLILLSLIGFWLGYESLGRRPALRSGYAVAGIVLAASSILLSLLLAISVNDLRSILALRF